MTRFPGVVRVEKHIELPYFHASGQRRSSKYVSRRYLDHQGIHRRPVLAHDQPECYSGCGAGAFVRHGNVQPAGGRGNQRGFSGGGEHIAVGGKHPVAHQSSRIGNTFDKIRNKFLGGILGQLGVEVDETDIDVASRERWGIQVVKNSVAVGVGIAHRVCLGERFAEEPVGGYLQDSRVALNLSASTGSLQALNGPGYHPGKNSDDGEHG